MTKTYFLYRIIKAAVRLVYPKQTAKDIENLPDEASVIVANHAQMNGPILCELYFPRGRYTWCAYEMMTLKEVPSYAYKDFWSKKPQILKPFYRLLSYIIAPLSVCVFNNANTVPVFHDRRIMATYRQSIRLLNEGKDLVIFPEKDEPYNKVVWQFQEGFADLARLYYKRYQKKLSFVPMYIAPTLKTFSIGRAIEFNPDADMDAERERIRLYLMDSIAELAKELGPHTVVPYPNMPRKDYPHI